MRKSIFYLLINEEIVKLYKKKQKIYNIFIVITKFI